MRWCRRHSGLLPAAAAARSDRFEIEFLLELVDLFALTGRLGQPGRPRSTPTSGRALYGRDAPTCDAAAAPPCDGCWRAAPAPAEWPALSAAGSTTS